MTDLNVIPVIASGAARSAAERSNLKQVNICRSIPDCFPSLAMTDLNVILVIASGAAHSAAERSNLKQVNICRSIPDCFPSLAMTDLFLDSRLRGNDAQK